MTSRSYVPSDAAREASDYYNALPFEERRKLAPLLEHYRQMGLAEAADRFRGSLSRVDARIRDIRDSETLADVLAGPGEK